LLRNPFKNFIGSGLSAKRCRFGFEWWRFAPLLTKKVLSSSAKETQKAVVHAARAPQLFGFWVLFR